MNGGGNGGASMGAGVFALLARAMLLLSGDRQTGAAVAASGEAAAPPEPESALVQAAFPLLDVVGRLPRLDQAPDPDGLHYNLLGALRRFQAEAAAAGYTPDQIRLAHFMLCATVDAAVLAAPWGQSWRWEDHGLLATFHRPWQRTPGLSGVLEYLREESEAHPEETTLARFCLLLGPPGMAAPDLRAALCRADGDGAGRPPETGSAPVPQRPLVSRFPLWTAAVASEAVLLVVYLLFSLALDGQAGEVVARLERLLPAAPAELVRVLPVSMGRSAQEPPTRDYLADSGDRSGEGPGVPVSVAAGSGSVAAGAGSPGPAALVAGGGAGGLARRQRLAAALVRALAKDVSARNLFVLVGEVRSADGRGTEGAAGIIRLPEARLFPPGRAAVGPNGRQLLLRVAAALEREGGVIHVAGHTDDPSPRGLDLSEARARAVAAVLRTRPALAGRVGSEGRGATEPLPPAQAPLGRSGRIDLLIRDRDSGAEP